ncbi:hypothetical protein JX265_008389 [Neoarthrinium moseri]|uniref:Uncharacterized protein n=1 Tax=Neoarthrinium moseri TaxID=1658444 RepID=A0A9P9WI52_9PEZI|nr:uncharacterized protein JN550_001392 [Neoarthrinium moseri]KAI1845027.1 hypothetical protein JX266_008820 [Neoarthrinium moseri]KAI1864665.1 hypothetical protein JX265_008389 [Neoarthrinium moseri]KAI1875896.1 hypothetical protein JN550_001392 [Neoarthrinium moseri]
MPSKRARGASEESDEDYNPDESDVEPPKPAPPPKKKQRRTKETTTRPDRLQSVMMIGGAPRWLCDHPNSGGQACKSTTKPDDHSISSHIAKFHKDDSAYLENKKRGVQDCPFCDLTKQTGDARFANFLSYQQHVRETHSTLGNSQHLKDALHEKALAKGDESSAWFKDAGKTSLFSKAPRTTKSGKDDEETDSEDPDGDYVDCRDDEPDYGPNGPGGAGGPGGSGGPPPGGSIPPIPNQVVDSCA